MRLMIINDNTLDQTNGVVTTFTNILKEIENKYPEITINYTCPYNFAHVRGFGYPDLSFPYNPWKIKQQMDDFKPTHIHIATEGVLGIAAKLVLDSRQWKYTTSYHTRWDRFIEEAVGFKVLGVERLLKSFHSNSKVIFAPTKSVVEYLHNMGLEKAIVWSRGIDTSQFKFVDKQQSKPPKLLTVGRVSVEKRMERFCELENYGYQLTLVGDGPALSSLKRKYPFCNYTGALFGQDLAEQYQNADAFVFTSESDTFGIVMIESMACGTPIAALPVDGPRDVVTVGVSGYLEQDLHLSVQKCLQLNRTKVYQDSKKYNWASVTDAFLENIVPIN